jgi:branched-chain amino acid aminotransferase
MADHTDPVSWIDGEWIAGNPPILGPMSHATWMASVAFDGARAFGRRAPDLGLHCARVVRSAEALGLTPPVTAAEIEALAWEGIERFPASAALYIRPLIYAEEGFVVPVPESAKFVLTLFEAPMPTPKGVRATLSPWRRPSPETAITQAKTASLYPNVARALREARAQGFDTAVVLDGNGNVAEFAAANLFMAKDGRVATPAINGAFLDGITRQRVLELLRADGAAVEERTVTLEELREADELFATGNYSKVVPCIGFEDRALQPGPAFERARALYFEYAEREGRRRAG